MMRNRPNRARVHWDESEGALEYLGVAGGWRFLVVGTWLLGVLGTGSRCLVSSTCHLAQRRLPAISAQLHTSQTATAQRSPVRAICARMRENMKRCEILGNYLPTIILAPTIKLIYPSDIIRDIKVAFFLAFAQSRHGCSDFVLLFCCCCTYNSLKGNLINFEIALELHAPARRRFQNST